MVDSETVLARYEFYLPAIEMCSFKYADLQTASA